MMRQTLRQGGICGILAVIIFVGGTLLPFVGGGIPAVYKLWMFCIAIAAPLLSLNMFNAYHAWFSARHIPQAAWMWSIALVGCGLWLLYGLLMSLVFQEDDPLGDRFAQLLYGAFLVISSALLLLELGLQFQIDQRRTPSVGIAANTAAILIVLSGQTQTFSPLALFVYGAPAVSIFFFSARLLRESDTLAV